LADIRRDAFSVSKTFTYRWDDPDADHSGDAAQDILSTPLLAEPGTTFAYRGANTYLLSRIIHGCSGQDLRDYLIPRLFTPLGIRNPQWQRCPLGHSLGAVGLLLRTEEIARLGRTLLEQGRYADRQLAPAAYVVGNDQRDDRHPWARRNRRDRPASGQCGIRSASLAVCPRRRVADGRDLRPAQHHAPRHDACVAVTSHYRGPTTDILDAIWSEIVPVRG
jgi:hypothetical protein